MSEVKINILKRRILSVSENKSTYTLTTVIGIKNLMLTVSEHFENWLHKVTEHRS